MEDVRKTPEIVRIGTGQPGPGRPRGVPNKWTRGARAALQMAFEKMGGVDALAQWGRKNPEIFYALYARLASSEPAYAVLETSEANIAVPASNMHCREASRPESTTVPRELALAHELKPRPQSIARPAAAQTSEYRTPAETE